MFGIIKLKNVNSEIVQRVYADHSFGFTKAKPFSLTLAEGKYWEFWIAQVLLLFHLVTRNNEKMSGNFVFVRYFEITPPIDNFDRFLNCLCFLMGNRNRMWLRSYPKPTIWWQYWRMRMVRCYTFKMIMICTRWNHFVSRFTFQLPWPLHRFHVICFIQHRH